MDILKWFRRLRNSRPLFIHGFDFRLAWTKIELWFLSAAGTQTAPRRPLLPRSPPYDFISIPPVLLILHHFLWIFWRNLITGRKNWNLLDPFGILFSIFVNYLADIILYLLGGVQWCFYACLVTGFSIYFVVLFCSSSSSGISYYYRRDWFLCSICYIMYLILLSSIIRYFVSINFPILCFQLNVNILCFSLITQMKVFCCFPRNFNLKFN